MLQSKKTYYPIGILFIIVSILTSSCRRYEEGPLVSVRTVNKRITGNYELTEFKINGVDKTVELKQAPGFCADLFFREINEGEYVLYNCDTNIISLQPVGGTYILYKHKKKIRFYKLNGYVPAEYKCFHEKDDSFRIHRLTMKDFWIEIEIDGDNYTIHFKKNGDSINYVI